MGSSVSKNVVSSKRLSAVHPWTPPAELPVGQRVTVRMRASEFRALAARRAVAASGGDIGRVILDGCMAGRWTWSPAS